MSDYRKRFNVTHTLNLSGVIRSRVGPEWGKAPIVMEPGDSPPHGVGDGWGILTKVAAERLAADPKPYKSGRRYYRKLTRVIRCGRNWLADYLRDFALHQYLTRRS